MAYIPYTITLLCMEPSRPAAVAEIVSRINREEGLPLQIRIHAHESAELVNEARRGLIGDEIGRSNLVVVSHVLMDEEVSVLEGLLRERAGTDTTVVVVSSAGELMRLTRVGRFSIGSRTPQGNDAQEVEPGEEKRESGAMRLKSLLRKITREKDITPYLKELMIVAPKLLKLIPGRMQDLRSYIEAYLYFIEISEPNLRSMFLMLADRYHAPLKGKLTGLYAPPIVYPSEGIYHPDAPEIFTSREKYLAWYPPHNQKSNPVNRKSKVENQKSIVGLLLLRGDILLRELEHIDRTIRAFEARGIGVIAAFGSSFDYRVAIEGMMLDSDGGGIDALISLTAFPLVGGHVRSDAAGAIEALERYGVPYFSPVPLLFQTVEEWSGSSYGLSPLQTALHVALPELEGAIEPLVTSGVELTSAGKSKRVVEERCGKLVRRVERWLTLRSKPNSQKKIALTIFSFPPSKGAVGTAAYLDIFRSLRNTLLHLRSEGYTVEIPASPEEMIEQIVIGEDKLAPLTSADLNIAARLRVDDYYELAGDHARRVDGMWGPAPGTLNSDGRDILIYGRHYGNVFVGVQPSFGFEGDPMRLLMAHGATPHHGFLGYYTWIEHLYCADAHLHFGTHGALEFMPGKQVGLDLNSWPDALIGDLPNLYLYSINNPSEGTIAKRRSLATLIGYLTPPLENAGLYRELVALKSMITSYHETPPSDPRRMLTVEALVEKVDQLNLDKDVPPPREDHEQEEFVGRLYSYLIEIESRLIPTGLHVVGEPPSRSELADLLLAVGEYDRPEHGVRSLTGLIAGSFGADYFALYESAERGDAEAMERYLEVRRIAAHGVETLLSEDGAAVTSKAQRQNAESVIVRTAGKGKLPTKELRRALDYLLSVAGRALEEHELNAMARGLTGSYITPAIGGDPVRVPATLPSGRNIHALDPSLVPSPVAIRNAHRVVDLMLARAFEERGCYPEHIGMILWGLDNIKTQGEAIAQAFILAGVEPVSDSLGRVSRLRVIPLSELGRPRIDVTVQASGICRDIFGLQLELLDEAFRLAASLDEPEDRNFIRRRTRELMASLGVDQEEAATRVFSNAAGAYGTNVDYTVGMSAWETKDDLAEIFTRRKSFAYGRGFSSREARRVFEELAAGIDTTFQNLDSSEVGITDVDHYFEYLGGLTNVVERRGGIRPTALVADTTTARGKVRTLEATIRLEARTKILNPKWFEGMLEHGYQGVEEIRKRLDYTFGFSATADAVDSWIYDSTHSVYVADPAMRERMRSLNPHAYTGLVHRLIEASERGFWQTGDETIEELRELSNQLEDRLEGVE